MPDTDAAPAPALDDETTAALTLFNEYVQADRERTQREKRVKKAERAKDEAAARVKKLGERGSAEEKAEAEAAYREAADRWKKLRDGEEIDDETPAAPATDAAEETNEADEAPAAEAEPHEVDEGAPVEVDEAAPAAETAEPAPEATADEEE